MEHRAVRIGLTTSLLLTGFLSFVLIGRVLSPEKTSRTSSAAEPSPSAQACGMSVNISVDEERADGTVVPLDFSKYADLDPAKWGFADTINMPPYSQPENVIHFNDPTLARYSAFTGDLSFVEFPKQSQIYRSEQTTQLTFFYQKDLYRLVKETGTFPTSDVPVECGHEIKVGWIVKRRTPTDMADIEVQQALGNSPVGKFISPDTNNDGTVNTLDVAAVIGAYGSKDPSADINKDGSVNGMDYMIVTEEILK